MLPNDSHIKGTSLSSSTAPPSASLPPDSPHHPSNIYHNLVLLEYDLRLQYLEQKAIRRLYSTIFYSTITITAWLGNRLFTFGGSPNTIIYAFERIFFFTGLAWLLYFYFSGEYQWKLVYPRKFVHNANRGMRQFNLKLVSVRMSWRERLEGLYYQFSPPHIPESRRRYLAPPASSHPVRRKRAPSIAAHQRQRSTTPEPSSVPKRPTPSRLGTPSSIHSSSEAEPDPPRSRRPEFLISQPEELKPSDLVPCGNYVKLVILPKGFSPEFREGWELYRMEFWEKENMIRATMRAEAMELLRREVEEELEQTKRDWLESLPFGIGQRWLKEEKREEMPVRRPRRMSTAKRRSLLVPESDQQRRSPSPYATGGEGMERSASSASVRMERGGSVKGASPAKARRTGSVVGEGSARGKRSSVLRERRTESGGSVG
ncbi:hypothetical protein BJ508DRAFT_2844 [Ascobolus immersus RN42]|uniref:Spo7-domain-containing protein n=1 Tax=Ascobolus immersus RN42 TaxID=1160509 RepID=A0A3N4IQB5_ASCIM|nr:hypothetical protein BJ508DRAFT_2844 [Ascobolus immersus RN42]